MEMINNIFDLSNISVGEIATHRTDIVAIPLDATLEDITNVITEEKYSRIVVYDESIDNIVGVFHVKDMVKYILGDAKRMEEDYFHIEDILMTPYFVPFSKKTDELFQDHLADAFLSDVVFLLRLLLFHQQGNQEQIDQQRYDAANDLQFFR